MTRRSFTIGALTSVLLPNQVLGQTAIGLPNVDYEALIQNAPLPFRQTPLYPEDAKRVVVFIAFNCPFCYQYHQAIWQWGQVLPRGWSMDYIPVLVEGVESYVTARFFWAVKQSAPERLGEFMSNAYEAVQRERMNLRHIDSWERLFLRSHIPLEKVGQAYQAQEGNEEPLFDAVITRQVHYKVAATPTVAIGGRYVTTPDGTQGNEAMFTQLLTGLVSKAEGMV